MGNFSTSIAIKTNDLDSVIQFLKKKKRVSFVSKPDNDFIYLYDEKCDQDPQQISQLCKKISSEFKCPILAFNNHDDDVLNYWLFVNGEKIDQYNSAPDYFKSAEGKPPKGGDPAKLCSIFNRQSDIEKLGDILHKKNSENNPYFLESNSHEAICEILGLNFQLSALSFELINNEDSESKKAGEFIEIGDTPSAIFKRKMQEVELEKEVFKKKGFLLNEINSVSNWYFCPKTGRLCIFDDTSYRENNNKLFYLEQNKDQVINSISVTESFVIRKIDNSGKYLVGNTGCQSELFDLNSGELLLTMKHTDSFPYAYCFNNDSTMLYILAGFLICISLPELQIIRKIPLPRYADIMALHPSGKFAVVYCRRKIVIVDLLSFSTHFNLYLGIIKDIHAEPYSNYINAVQTISAGLPINAKSNILDLAMSNELYPRSFVFSPDGTQLYIAGSKGLWIYNWSYLLKPGTNHPKPIEVYTSLEFPTDKNTISGGYAGDVCFDANHNLLLYSNNNGIICYIDVSNKSQGILLECPGKPDLYKLGISPDGQLLVCRANIFHNKKNYYSLQIWNYQELLKEKKLA